MTKSLRDSKSAPGGRKGKREVSYNMIEDSPLPVGKACSVLNVSRDAFYSWLKNPFRNWIQAAC